jgi:hypothetical protein
VIKVLSRKIDMIGIFSECYKKKVAFLIVLFVLSCSSEIPFDRRKWNEKDDLFYKYRMAMLNDLVEHQLKTKMKREEVLNLLGPSIPYTDVSEAEELVYEIYEDYGMDIDPVEIQYLMIQFNKDSTIRRANLQTWTKERGDEEKELKAY